MKAGALLNKAKRQIGGKTHVGGSEDFVQNVTRFKDLERKVKEIAENLKKYEKTILAITPVLEKLSLSIVEFYCEEEYATYGREFANSSATVSEAVRNFQSEQANLRQELDDYLSRISSMKKSLQVDEDLYSSVKDKEKTVQKGGKNVNVATEKYQAAKESYESKHEEVASQLAALVQSKHSDFESKFTAIVEAQRHLFSKMSNTFTMPALGLSVPSAPSRKTHDTLDVPSSHPLSARNDSPAPDESDVPSLPTRSIASSRPGLESEVTPRALPPRVPPPTHVPVPTMPERPNPTMPERPHPTMPERSTPTMPERPTPTMPESPMMPERPHPTMPERPNPMMPERPNPMMPERPNPVMPERPHPTMPERPNPVMPERPHPTMPERPNPMMPERPNPMMPERPSMPERPHPTMPERPQIPPANSERPMPPLTPGRSQPPPPERTQVAPPIQERGPPSMPSRPKSIMYSAQMQEPLPPIQGRPPVPGRVQSAMFSAPLPPSHHTPDGKLAVVPEAERRKYEDLFRNQDPSNTGIIPGAVAFGMFSRCGLPNDQMAIIWELSDQDKDGNLSMEEFVLAMYLINAKLRNHIVELPTSLTPEYTINPVLALPAPSPPTPSHLPPSPSPGAHVAPQEDYTNQFERQAQQYVGKQVGNAALDRQNQQAMGVQIAANTQNPIVAKLATNSTVQRGAGQMASKAANDPRVQQAATDQLKTQAANQAKKGFF